MKVCGASRADARRGVGCVGWRPSVAAAGRSAGPLRRLVSGRLAPGGGRLECNRGSSRGECAVRGLRMSNRRRRDAVSRRRFGRRRCSAGFRHRLVVTIKMCRERQVMGRGHAGAVGTCGRGFAPGRDNRDAEGGTMEAERPHSTARSGRRGLILRVNWVRR